MGLTRSVSEIAKKIDPNLSLVFLIKGVLIKEKACNKDPYKVLTQERQKSHVSSFQLGRFRSEADIFDKGLQRMVYGRF